MGFYDCPGHEGGKVHHPLDLLCDPCPDRPLSPPCGGRCDGDAFFCDGTCLGPRFTLVDGD